MSTIKHNLEFRANNYVVYSVGSDKIVRNLMVFTRRDQAQVELERRNTLAASNIKAIANIDLGIEWADEGRWRNYELTASGNSLEEMLFDATVSEVDQDGEEITCYGLDQGNHVTDVAHDYITKLWQK